MSSLTLNRLSGTALLLGSLIATCGALLKIGIGLDPHNPLWLPGFLFVLVGSVLLVLGLPGMFVQQVSKAGTVGVIGFVIFSGALLIIGVSGAAINAFVLPAFVHVTSQEPAALTIFFVTGDLLQFVGTLILGIALIRARTVPIWVGVLVILSGVVLLGGRGLHAPTFVYVVLSPLLLYIALLWSGYILWSRQDGGGVLAQTMASNMSN